MRATLSVRSNSDMDVIFDHAQTVTPPG
jgi:hypothetical protein